MLIIMHYYQNSQSHEGYAEDENGFVHFERRRCREIISGDASSILMDKRAARSFIYHQISFIIIVKLLDLVTHIHFDDRA